MFMDTALGSTLAAWMAPLLPSQKAFYIYLLCAFVIAGGSWLYFSHREENARPDGVEKGFLAWVFDPRIWFHRSAKQDYLYFVLNALIYYGIVAQLLVSGHIFFNAFGNGLEWAFGHQDSPVFAPSHLTAAATRWPSCLPSTLPSGPPITCNTRSSFSGSSTRSTTPPRF